MPRKKRRAAWGALTQVDESTWRLRYWATGPDGYKRRSKTIRGSRKDAERARAELMLAHSDDAPCPTVGEVWRTFLEPDLQRMTDAGEYGKQTLKQTQSTWRCHVEPTWGDIQCDAVRPLGVQQWLTSMGYTQANAARSLLRRILDYAVRYEYAPSNPMSERYVMPPRSTVARRDDGVWTLDELGEVWRAVRGEWFEAAFLLAAFGGLRVGEALGVRSEDVGAIEVDGITITTVEVARQVTNRGELSDALKNEQSRRVVAIPGRAGRRLRTLAAAGGYLTNDGFGGHATQHRLQASWRAALAGVGPSMRHPFRNLRNSWQTNMRWTLRVPPYMIEPMMGHVGEGVTGRHYDRPDAEMFADAVADAYRSRPFDAGWSWATWDD